MRGTHTPWGICYGLNLHASNETCVVHPVKNDLQNAQYQTEWHSLWLLFRAPWCLSVNSYLLKQIRGLVQKISNIDVIPKQSHFKYSYRVLGAYIFPQQCWSPTVLARSTDYRSHFTDLHCLTDLLLHRLSKLFQLQMFCGIHCDGCMIINIGSRHRHLRKGCESS